MFFSRRTWNLLPPPHTGATQHLDLQFLNLFVDELARQLQVQLDAMSKGQYALAAAFYQDAYAHMFMTADLLAGAFAKQKDLPK